MEKQDQPANPAQPLAATDTPRRTLGQATRYGMAGALSAALLLALQACGGGDATTSATPLGAPPVQPAAAISTDCTPFPTATAAPLPLPTAEQVLGFDWGSREVTSDEVLRYMRALDDASDRVVTGEAARSVQGRALSYAIVGRADRLTPAGLEAVRSAIDRLADPSTPATTAAALAAATPAILWISAGVHGNEESGTDAALRVLYELAARQDCAAQGIRENALVVILPNQNPDGREADTRRNAYGFDMNRDWFARTQPETDGKLELMRRYRPVLHIDAHETSLKDFFFPPTADPTYHEVPRTAFGWINELYSPAIANTFRSQKIRYFHGAPYDLYAMIYGDSVPTVGFQAAGMTFEKHNGDPIATRAREHYLAMWSSLFAAAGQKDSLLTAWHAGWAEAAAQGARGDLQPNALTYDGKSLYQQLPDQGAGLVRHYFLSAADPARTPEVNRLVQRLQRMDVQVWQLRSPLAVNTFRPYGGNEGAATLPAGTYWIPMAQGQKHWIQAMLNHDPYIPVGYSYDITAWSNPLLMNVAGGSSRELLTPDATLVPPMPATAPFTVPAAVPRIGLLELSGTSGFEAAGSLRHLFEQVWKLPYRAVTADRLVSELASIDVLLVPDGSASSTLKTLGNKGQKALRTWVEQGGRYVGYLGGTELAVKTGISTAVLSNSGTAAPGTLIRVVLTPADPQTNPLAQGMDSVWLLYNDNPVMQVGQGRAAVSFPTGTLSTSGLAIGVNELTGSAAVVDEPLGQGRSVVFSFDPNFRGWTDGTQRLLWNALLGPNPAPAMATTASARLQAEETAIRSVRTLPEGGKAIRLTVQATDEDLTRTLLDRYGAEYKVLRKAERTVFVVANPDGLSREEHPYALQLLRELRTQISPIAVNLP